MITGKFLLAGLSLALLASAADLPASILRHSVNTSVTNKDVLTLAKAGLDEEFIIRTLLGARCSCDTTAEAVASLAEQGISQRVIEVMLDVSYTATPGMVVPVVPSLETAPVMETAPVSTPAKPSTVRQYAVRPSLAAMAIAARVPYYEEHSALWGLWRKQTGVSSTKGPDRPFPMIPVQVGDSWQYVSVPATLPSPRSAKGRSWHTAAFGMPGMLAAQ